MMDENDENFSELGLLAEKIFTRPTSVVSLAYCPTMDLIALSNADEKVNVFRLNGQRAFGLDQKVPAKVKGLMWKPNGQSLAVAWSDNIIRIVSSDAGKVIHEIGISAESDSQITCTGWGVNFTNSELVKSRLKVSVDGSSLDDILNQASHISAAELPLDLPRDLSLLEIDNSLPKLSILAPGPKNEDIFSSRASMDAIFHSSKTTMEESVDVLLIGSDDGSIHLTIYDSFDIGSFSLQSSSQLREGKAILHSSHPFCSTHSLLVTTSTSTDHVLYFLPLDLRFISNSGPYLSLIASRSTQLQNLLRYIQQLQSQMQAEWRGSQELPRRFMQNVGESLQERSHCSLVHAAYHLVVTGHCYPAMKEWLVEELQERGHKRWEMAVVTGYENIRRLLHENLLPALDRCTVLVSRLRGLSRFPDSNLTLGARTLDLNNILDTIRCINLLAHNMLSYSTSELRQFLAFSNWLRHEIDVQGSEHSAASEQLLDKDSLVDHNRVLQYVEGAMTRSYLSPFLESPSPDELQYRWDLAAEGMALYEMFKRQIEKYNQGIPIEKRLPEIGDLTTHLTNQCEVVFHQIAETQKRNVLFGAMTSLGGYEGQLVAHMRMKTEVTAEKETPVSYVAVRSSESRNHLEIFRILLDIENGLSSTKKVDYTTVAFERGMIKDVKFVDDESLILILSDEESSCLLKFSYIEASEGGRGLLYHPWPLSGRSSRRFVSTLATKMCTIQRFPKDRQFMPSRLEVNGRKGRRAVCVVNDIGSMYRVFDLDGENVPDERYLERESNE